MTATSGGHSGHIAEIDALRCFAMTGVILEHTGLFPIGWMGVWLFFVISGFVITRSLIKEKQIIPALWPFFGIFFFKRFIRIVPLYVFYIVLCLAIAAWIGQDLRGALPSLLTFSYNWDWPEKNAYPFVSHLWSISGEEQFYILFPFIFWRCSKAALVKVLLSIMIAAPLARAILAGSFDPDASLTRYTAQWIYAFTPAHFDAFAAGALLAIYVDTKTITRRAGWIALLTGGGVLVAAIGFCAAGQAWRSGIYDLSAFRNIVSGTNIGDFREAYVYTAVTLAAASILIAVLAKVGPVTSVCRPAIFRKIGTVSYGAYVYHGLTLYFAAGVTQFAAGLTGKMAVFGATYIGTLVLAALSFRLLESPIMRFGKAILQSQPRRVESAVAE